MAEPTVGPPVDRRGARAAARGVPGRHDLEDPVPREPGPHRAGAHAVGVPQVLRGRRRAAAAHPARAARALPAAAGHQGPASTPARSSRRATPPRGTRRRIRPTRATRSRRRPRSPKHPAAGRRAARAERCPASASRPARRPTSRRAACADAGVDPRPSPTAEHHRAVATPAPRRVVNREELCAMASITLAQLESLEEYGGGPAPQGLGRALRRRFGRDRLGRWRIPPRRRRRPAPPGMAHVGRARGRAVRAVHRAAAPPAASPGPRPGDGAARGAERSRGARLPRRTDALVGPPAPRASEATSARRGPRGAWRGTPPSTSSKLAPWFPWSWSECGSRSRRTPRCSCCARPPVGTA